MKIKTLLLAGLMLAGCATTPTQTYRPANYAGPAWTIEGHMKPGLIDYEITVKINSQSVVTGKMTDFQDTAEFTGQYEGRKINASCSKIQTMRGVTVQCLVFVDGERAATLQF